MTLWRKTALGIGTALMLYGAFAFVSVSFFVGEFDDAPGELSFTWVNPIWLVALGVLTWAGIAFWMWRWRKRPWLTLAAPVAWIVAISVVAIQVCGAGVLVAASC